MTISLYPRLYQIYTGGETIDISKTENKQLIQELQKLLNEKGFNAGEIDGIAGQNTLKAFAKAKDYLHLQNETLLGKFTLQKLADMKPRLKFFHPTDNIGVITSPYGWRLHPVHGGRRFHHGVDIGSVLGTKVYAVADGRVSYMVGSCRGMNNNCGGGYGNHVRIAHSGLDDFDESLYAHLQNVAVRPDQVVKAGEFIGSMGSTGFSTGPHLHFETRLSGKSLDPVVILDVL